MLVQVLFLFSLSLGRDYTLIFNAFSYGIPDSGDFQVSIIGNLGQTTYFNITNGIPGFTAGPFIRLLTSLKDVGNITGAVIVKSTSESFELDGLSIDYQYNIEIPYVPLL